MTFPGTAIGSWPLKPFSQWGQTEAMQVVAAGLDMRSLAKNRLFYLGDHWQGGEGWIGPWPDWTDETASASVAEIERGFTARNVIKEVIERHVASVVGREPTWGLSVKRALKEGEKPTKEEQTLIDEAEAFLTTWWNNVRSIERFQDATRKLLYSGGSMPISGTNTMIDTQNVGGGMTANGALRKISAPGRAVMRLYVPAALLSTEEVVAEDGSASSRKVLQVKAGDIEDALSKIHIDVPEVEMAHVYEDPTRLDEIGVCNVQARIDQQQSAQMRVELTYLDDGNMTVLATVGTSSSQQATTDANPGGQVQARFDLGKRLLMSELTREPFISHQVRDAQKALNFANSMIPRNVTTGGFLEQIILGGAMPGHFEGEGTARKWVPEPYVRGAGVTQWIAPIEYDDATGNKHVTSPSVVNRPPVPPTASIEAKREAYRDILEECDQAHILITGEATPSGKSREQSRADFEQSLKLTQTPVERTGRWLIETVMAWAEVFANVPGKYTKTLRASFNCAIDTGPLSTQERANDIAAGQAGYMSRQTIMERSDVADPDAELQRIMEQDGGDLEVQKLKAEVYGFWISAGLSEEAAAELAHLSDDEQAIIAKMVKDLAAAPPMQQLDAQGRPITAAPGAPPTGAPTGAPTRGAPNQPAKTGLPQPGAFPRRLPKI
jgi:hypothetical protein